jgi:hypothetical protein
MGHLHEPSCVPGMCVVLSPCLYKQGTESVCGVGVTEVMGGAGIGAGIWHEFTQSHSV